MRKFLSVAVLGFLCPGFGGSSTPSETFKTTLLKANEGKYSEIKDTISGEGKKFSAGLGGDASMWNSLTKYGMITKVEVLKEDIRGEGATLDFKITYKDGVITEGSESFVKENGKWKASFMGIAKFSSAKIQAMILNNAITSFYVRHMQYPNAMEDLCTGDHPIVDNRETLKNPWGNPYQFRVHEDGTLTVFSFGPSGKEID